MPPRQRTNTAAVKALVAKNPGAYAFTIGTKHYALPPASECATHVDAGTFIDAALDGGGAADVKLGLKMLTAVGDDGKPLVDEDTMTALRSLPMPEFIEHLGAWMQKSGATPGESASSAS
jgi:hypothetical protein